MFGIQFSAGLLVALVIVVFILANSIKILPEYERGVVFRLGRLRPIDYGPGIFVLIPIADRMVRISLRTVVHDVPPQDIITRDNVSVKVNAVVYYRVMNPRRAVVDVENFHYATSQLAQTTLRSVLGQVELDTLLSEREKLNQQLQTILDKHTDPWGIKVSAVEVTEAVLARVRDFNPRLNCFITVMEDEAMAAARRAGLRARCGGRLCRILPRPRRALPAGARKPAAGSGGGAARNAVHGVAQRVPARFRP